MTVVPTNAALCKVTVSKKVYEQDVLLQLVCNLASPLQLTVKLDAKSPLQLEAQTVVLKQRNTILRALCGIALHHALDNQGPYYLLGGAGGSPVASGKLVQWMSLTDSIRSSSPATADDDFLSTLEQHLEENAFLIGSSQASLADMDLALVLASKEMDPAAYMNIIRWRETVLNAMKLLPTHKPVAIPSVASTRGAPPVFFYGTEDVATILKPKAKVQASKKESASAKEQPQGGKDKQQQQPKQAKKNKGGPQQQQQQAPAAFTISALDIRVGKITKAWHHEEADKLFCEEIDLGNGEMRQIASGLRPFYKTEDLQDRMVLVLCNLKKRNLVGFPSHGMVLCASNADHTAVEFVVPPAGSKPGDRVTFEGHATGDPEPENKVAKKKIFEGLAPDLKTDKDGQVNWKGALAKTEAGGVVKALNGMPNAQVS